MLTTGEAARLLGVTAQTVINWIESGKLEAVRVGRGRRRVLDASLRLLVGTHSIPAEANAPDLWKRVRGEDAIADVNVATFIADSSHRIVHWNNAMEKLLGWTPTERLGVGLSEIAARVPGLPVDLAELAREPGEETFLSLQLEFVRRDNSRIAASTTISWIRNAKGGSIGTAFVLEPVATDAPSPPGRRGRKR
jgi:excisionase family DNA binding protein/PAS domain S-box-containing protein